MVFWKAGGVSVSSESLEEVTYLRIRGRFEGIMEGMLYVPIVRGCLDDLGWDPIQSTFSFSPFTK
jgi:hypothetical protein